MSLNIFYSNLIKNIRRSKLNNSTPLWQSVWLPANDLLRNDSLRNSCIAKKRQRKQKGRMHVVRQGQLLIQCFTVVYYYYLLSFILVIFFYDFLAYQSIFFNKVVTKNVKKIVKWALRSGNSSMGSKIPRFRVISGRASWGENCYTVNSVI